jgi:hypothetical protein
MSLLAPANTVQSERPNCRLSASSDSRAGPSPTIRAGSVARCRPCSTPPSPATARVSPFSVRRAGTPSRRSASVPQAQLFLARGIAHRKLTGIDAEGNDRLPSGRCAETVRDRASHRFRATDHRMGPLNVKRSIIRTRRPSLTISS